MITLSNGKKLEFLLASGMMGFDGRGATLVNKMLYKILKRIGLFDQRLFTIITKTITLPRVKGHKKIRPIKDGWWNDYGLDNPGLNGFLRKYITAIRKTNNIIISITAYNKDDLEIIINSLNTIFPKLTAVEFNVSCSNVKILDTKNIITLCFHLFKLSKFPIILKIGANNEYVQIAKITERIVQAIDINSVPLSSGAISGKRIQPLNWRILRELVDSTLTPIIGPSVWNYEDIEKLFLMGARAVSFGSVSMIHPDRLRGPILPTKWVIMHKKERNGYLL